MENREQGEGERYRGRRRLRSWTSNGHVEDVLGLTDTSTLADDKSDVSNTEFGPAFYHECEPNAKKILAYSMLR